MGAEEGPKGPKFSPVSILVVRRWTQLCQNRGTVFLQRRQRCLLRKGWNPHKCDGEGVEKDTAGYLRMALLGASLLGYQCVRNAVVFLRHQLVWMELLLDTLVTSKGSWSTGCLPCTEWATEQGRGLAGEGGQCSLEVTG